ncbi:BCCT family transporter, partial [Psychrobacter sp. T6-1]
MADLKGFNDKEQGRSHNLSAATGHLTRTEVSTDTLGLKNPAFWYSGGFITLFVLMAIFAEEQLGIIVNTAFAWSA